MKSFLNDKDIRDLRNFRAPRIGEAALERVSSLSKKIRRDILSMTINAGSGHIGGSMSSADIYLMLWLCTNCTPENMNDDLRDRIVISHGHTSPGLYSVLGNFGYFNVEDAIQGFRKRDSIFEGHPSVKVPGVEWGSGSLGQGLSVGCGFAVASKIRKQSYRTYVVMGDGEQQKGQITEACEFASKHKLFNLTAIVDVNRLQASGATRDIMPANIEKKYEAAGWNVISVDGHDFRELYLALKYSLLEKEKPVAILANTIMGKGYSSIENNYEYHGRLLSRAQHEEALDALGENDFNNDCHSEHLKQNPVPAEQKINIGTPVQYEAGKSVDCRTAAGAAVYDIIKTNPDIPVAVLDCDLVESVKTGKVLEDFPYRFIECGIQEHNAATVCGALSKAGVIPFFLDFGVFGIDETYGQHRMNDTNNTSAKIIITHCGLDVGEDGKTHQCIDYISLASNLPGYKIIVPADANQTDRVIRYIASTPGNFIVAMGRSKVPVIASADGAAIFSSEYHFNYGRGEWLREGKDAVVITTGSMAHRAVSAAAELSSENIHVGVLNISCPLEPDAQAIKKACDTGIVITYEDHLASSGLGSAVASFIAENSIACRFKKMGVTQYGKSAPSDEQYPLQNLDSESLKVVIRNISGNRQ